MTITEFLLGSTFNDEIFGVLKLNRISSQRYWHGKVNFAPLKHEITIYIFDLENGVSEKHRQFYRELQNNYSEMVESIEDCLNKEYNKLNGELLHKDVWNKFTLTALTFPSQEELNKKSFCWEMSYAYNSSKPEFSVEMKNWELQECYSGE